MYDVSIGLLWPLFSLITGLFMMWIVRFTESRPIEDWEQVDWFTWTLLTILAPLGIVFTIYLLIEKLLVNNFSWQAIKMFFVKERTLTINRITVFLITMLVGISIWYTLYLYLLIRIN